jgi:glycosyltransferase involved in cell wall biosynthesis
MGYPLVSVLMTAYNREKYIAAAIESVLASTFSDYELVIVDDCSADRTVEIARMYAGRDERIKLFINEKNLGQFENRNRAARLSTGKYLKYLDSDDLLYPTGLDVLVTMMERFPEAGYGLCSLEQDDECVYPFMLSPNQAYERHFIRKIQLFHKAPLSSIIKKGVYFEVGGFTNPHGEGDYEMWLLLSQSHQVVLMPEGVAWYRVHEEQIDFRRRSDPFLRFRYYLVTLKYLSQDCPLQPEQIRQITRETHRNMTKDIVRSFFIYSPGKAAQMYRAAGFRFDQLAGYCVDALVSKLPFFSRGQ